MKKLILFLLLIVGHQSCLGMNNGEFLQQTGVGQIEQFFKIITESTRKQLNSLLSIMQYQVTQGTRAPEDLELIEMAKKIVQQDSGDIKSLADCCVKIIDRLWIDDIVQENLSEQNKNNFRDAFLLFAQDRVPAQLSTTQFNKKSSELKKIQALYTYCSEFYQELTPQPKNIHTLLSDTDNVLGYTYKDLGFTMSPQRFAQERFSKKMNTAFSHACKVLFSKKPGSVIFGNMNITGNIAKDKDFFKDLKILFKFKSKDDQKNQAEYNTTFLYFPKSKDIKFRPQNTLNIFNTQK